MKKTEAKSCIPLIIGFVAISLALAAFMVSIAQLAVSDKDYYQNYSVTEVFTLSLRPQIYSYLSVYPWGNIAFGVLAMVWAGTFMYLPLTRGRVVALACVAFCLPVVSSPGVISYVAIFGIHEFVLSTIRYGLDGEEWSEGSLILFVSSAWIILSLCVFALLSKTR